jgi:acyl carrier protein
MNSIKKIINKNTYSLNNKEKYNKIFSDSLSVDLNIINEKLKYNDIPEWDSIGHMSLMSGLEEGFKISLDTDDIVDFSSYTKGLEILKKYKVSV